MASQESLRCWVIVVLLNLLYVQPNAVRGKILRTHRSVLMLGLAVFILTVEVPLSGRTVSCPRAAICTRIGELTNISPIHIHDEDLALATGTWPEGHKKDLPTVGRP